VFIARFWRENDPDPSTIENEAQLEYWSRVTQAYFLFYNVRRGLWDERGEVYVRYGPPAQMDYDPVGRGLSWSFGTGGAFPANTMVWSYPELGLTVSLQDRLLSEFYMLPISLDRDMDPVPDPDALARSGDVLATRGGRGVFRLLPPGTRPLPVQGLVARFEGLSGPRVLGQLEAPGGPDDSLRVEWVMLDSARVERARASQTLTPSACAATTRRVSDFAAEVPPGAYLVSATVRGGDGRQGILRRPVDLPAPPEDLELSDVVVACGAPEVGADHAVRVQPNPAALVSGAGPLTAYFEIYHLHAGSDGLARFQYVYSVRSLARDDRFWLQKLLAPRPAPAISVSREEQNLGGLRRQFISVPVGALPPGPYRLEIMVRDLDSGAEAERRVAFQKTG
jgi:GWxTD domain-containing protein